MDTFIDRARSRRQDLVDERERLETDYRRLAERIQALDASLAEIDGHIEFYGSMMGVQSQPIPVSVPRYGDLAAMSVVAGCEAVLRAEGGKAKVAYIREQLTRAGKLKGKSANGDYATVFQAMKRHPEKFRSAHGSGDWQLVGSDAATGSVRPPGFVPPSLFASPASALNGGGELDESETP